jgi:hypothetical protein
MVTGWMRLRHTTCMNRSGFMLERIESLLRQICRVAFLTVVFHYFPRLYA